MSIKKIICKTATMRQLSSELVEIEYEDTGEQQVCSVHEKCVWFTALESSNSRRDFMVRRIWNLEQQLHDALKVISFYGETTNWMRHNPENHFLYGLIILDDAEEMGNGDRFGGKTARNFLREGQK